MTYAYNAKTGEGRKEPNEASAARGNRGWHYRKLASNAAAIERKRRADAEVLPETDAQLIKAWQLAEARAARMEMQISALENERDEAINARDAARARWEATHLREMEIRLEAEVRHYITAPFNRSAIEQMLLDMKVIAAPTAPDLMRLFSARYRAGQQRSMRQEIQDMKQADAIEHLLYAYETVTGFDEESLIYLYKVGFSPGEARMLMVLLANAGKLVPDETLISVANNFIEDKEDPSRKLFAVLGSNIRKKLVKLGWPFDLRRCYGFGYGILIKEMPEAKPNEAT